MPTVGDKYLEDLWKTMRTTDQRAWNSSYPPPKCIGIRKLTTKKGGINSFCLWIGRHPLCKKWMVFVINVEHSKPGWGRCRKYLTDIAVEYYLGRKLVDSDYWARKERTPNERIGNWRYSKIKIDSENNPYDRKVVIRGFI
jgi:hypothetical protein